MPCAITKGVYAIMFVGFAVAKGVCIYLTILVILWWFLAPHILLRTWPFRVGQFLTAFSLVEIAAFELLAIRGSEVEITML